MKKTLALSLLIGGGLVLSGCQFVSLSQDDIQPVVETKTMVFQATTALTMVEGFDSPTLKTLGRLMNQEGDPIEEANIPIATLDMLFNNGSSFTVEQKASDREGYTNLDVISFKILNEETITYSLYYNVETLEEPDDETSEDISVEVSEEPVTSEDPIVSEDPITSETPIVSEEPIISEEPATSVTNGLTAGAATKSRHGQGGQGHGHHGDHDGEDGDLDEDIDETEVEDSEEDEYGHMGGDAGHMGDDENGMPGHGNGGNGNQGHGHGHGKDHYRVTGLAVVGDEEYRFMSKTETDTDGDEQEVELKFMMFKDEGNFISIKQEIETEGIEGEVGYSYEEDFKYMVVKDNELVKSFKLELDHEDDGQELEVKIDGVKYEVTYETIEDRVYIHVSVRGQGEFTYEKVVTVNEETSEVSVDYILQ